MKQRNPYEPPSIGPKLIYGSITRVAYLATWLLALLALSVALMTQFYLVLPLVFAVAGPWTAGFRFVTCFASTFVAYLFAFIGIEVALEATEWGPAITELSSGLYSRMLVTSGLVFAFTAVFVTLVTRKPFNMLLKMHIESDNKVLSKLLKT